MKVTINLVRDLYHFYDKIQKGELLLPPHHKGDVWPAWKKKKWLDAIEEGDILSGCIITYNLAGDNRIWINDGTSRTKHTLCQYVEDCKASGKDYMKILHSCYISHQHIEYKNEQEAVEHFRDMNYMS